tara:strand:+ start:965 stop:1762 length:798 start_codon:yes stop_codon:yes gene_type:complete
MYKPLVEWIATVSGVETTMPIVRASELKPSWMKKSAKDFKEGGSITKQYRHGQEMYENPAMQKFNPEENRHTSKCPGLQMWHNTGWIMRLHQDVKIEIIGDGENFKWITPSQTSGPPLISSHQEQAMYPFFDNWPKNTMKRFIKFNLPWMARIPKGYKLLQLHPFWLDDFRFTTCSGILDPQLGHAAVGTIPVFWHSTSGETLVKAGTPLAQFILIPKDEPDYSQTDKDSDPNFVKEGNMTKQLLYQSFNRNYNKVREFWNKYGW